MKYRHMLPHRWILKYHGKYKKPDKKGYISPFTLNVQNRQIHRDRKVD